LAVLDHQSTYSHPYQKGVQVFKFSIHYEKIAEIAANMLFDQQISTNKPEELEALSSEMSPGTGLVGIILWNHAAMSTSS